jgi:Serine/threonine protein kinase
LNDIKCDDVICNYANPLKIYEGGQRIVYRIDHPIYGYAALKIGYYASPSRPIGWELARIEREIEILRQIDSPFYPKNYDFQKISESRYLILEEFLNSPMLEDKMEQFNSPLSALIFIKQLATGLKIIWDKKIVHRDLNPKNILINEDNSPRIIDLGIARVLDSASITQTKYGGPLSQDYAAPEQHRYNKALINWRTDQFNLGIILMQLLLNGHHPFSPQLVEGKSIPDNIMNDNWYRQAITETHLLPIKSLVTNMLSFEQYGRYRTFEDFMIDLNFCLEVMR